MSHTPGPWQASRPLYKSRYRAITPVFNGQTIAYVHHSLSMSTVANANLIAAAPDLLAALERIAEVTDNEVAQGVPVANAMRETARAAIAKARGQ